jgi:hypothetical protein
MAPAAIGSQADEDAVGDGRQRVPVLVQRVRHADREGERLRLLEPPRATASQAAADDTRRQAVYGGWSSVT